jgi:hypothetical protein
VVLQEFQESTTTAILKHWYAIFILYTDDCCIIWGQALCSGFNELHHQQENI